MSTGTQSQGPHVVRTTASAPQTPYLGRLFFHVGTAAVMASGFQAMQSATTFGEFVEPQYGGFYQFLTILGLICSGIAMLFSGASDLLPNITLIRLIKRVFLLISLPVELVISSIYWSIILTAPELMLPPTSPDAIQGAPSSSDAGLSLFRIPLWIDLSMHLVPAIALLIDFFLLEKKYPKPFSTYVALFLAAAFGTSYGIWVEHCASINGAFPYPFLTIMELKGRVLTYIGATLGAWGVFRGLNGLHK
ncbi:hypothetical protein I307_06152 [Cryptococcus deuterogattii 99/473]|uniref:FAR-17a/AIG1-like protein n=2 Tax=Cryptococcus deuterogattii TaxID=1859096 RepID=A0A0D0UZ79_9TREE|nr:hypothetical protein CNBG_0035 [Cryptococcus deuterogattii R265]KIR24936.1 hypothetical protein I309_06220 [Cryptococcus deuterogattii LA55]KIR32329.1 hypothetical protein I352_05156 [Cryptococcus deuterogattii MMRL2647]KIR37985.1 hypothetical protein I313_05980 [Cryptococcus deuterogattii Ram5]KIR74032.1 hypothetical protein I310_01629 [Cryptococcus deuterogattii CA1014]KIR94481.1 hypothetical protein I304_02123 [Cryptococcus deuterogattii CBS 10090]KIR96733.1 hypothetical protein L804_05